VLSELIITSLFRLGRIGRECSQVIAGTQA
jgi:hypothetical protein